MTELVSVCIPTYERPALLKAAIQSCFDQSHRPLLIIVGDDSRSSNTADMLAELSTPPGVHLEYLPRADQASQRENIVRLFARVTTPYAALLHDDDMFAPGGLDALMRAALEHTDAVGIFGTQDVVDPEGKRLDVETASWNRLYRRAGNDLDREHSVWFSVLTLQLPSNGYVLKSKHAKNAIASLAKCPGSAVDVAFALSFAQTSPAGRFFVSSDVTHHYRLTPGAETERLDHLPIFEVLRNMSVPEPYRHLKDERLATFLIAAINERLSRGDIETARQLILSDIYPRAKRWHAMGLFHTAAAYLRLPAGVIRLPYAISGKRRFAHASPGPKQ